MVYRVLCLDNQPGLMYWHRLRASQDWGRQHSSTPFSRPRSRITQTIDVAMPSRLTRQSKLRSPRQNWRKSSSKVWVVAFCAFSVPLAEKRSVRLTVIDTPGFGDYVNNRDSWMPIIEFLDDQHESYMLQEQQPRRVDKIDLRVHACLYFIRPTGHTLKPLDIEVMKRLSSRVNLIPVVAKADTLSPADLVRFKQRVSPS